MVKFRKLWLALAAASLCTTAFLIIGFGFVLKDMLIPVFPKFDVKPVNPERGAPAAPVMEETGEIRIAALGDSLTKGTGDSTGEGYVKKVVEGLMLEKGKPVRMLNNLAINGLQADELADRLADDRGFQYVLKQANLILLTIGGNDLFNSVRASNAGRKLSAYSLKGLSNRLPEAMERFERVIAELHSINANATIIYIGLYNPFYDIEELRSGSLEVQQWNKEAYTVIQSYPNMMMIPVFDLFEWNIGNYLSSDHFHPNGQGYERIADRILESLK
ncbi:GDSL-type esterase/lipase family protein [Paenibacillus prosopidis]|uniref:Lysophospholipase L1-like esterase n=1 Tax=Paenibacillus prosopidis TaxID=630520 RepID=A0A368W6H7_9BACL|nr:GDSL-type esterase/lipase family protein [Paenibacillus prosopidis]RCW51028.1 lysophospholipase L1-like esterase [Paenibacillus prosopidis]